MYTELENEMQQILLDSEEESRGKRKQKKKNRNVS
jgi:hypothetical protein